jgi:hypothetical protein
MADHGLYEEDISALWGAQDTDVLQPAPPEVRGRADDDPHAAALGEVVDTLREVKEDLAALRREVADLHEAVQAARLWLPVSGSGSRSG